MKITHQLTDQAKQTLAAAANNFSTIANQLGREELIDDVPSMLQQLDQGTFRLVVMGEIKKGKSSFLNALLGLGSLLPTDVDVATSTVYKIIHGPERKIKVFFLPDAQTGRQLDPLEISESQVAEYGTEDGNPGNRKYVDFIAVELPSDLLATGLTIIDTPGVGGLYKSHRGITWRYAPNADAIIFVLDSTESVISNDEIDFLRELTGKITQRVYFVQTKTDMVGREQREAWEIRNKEILAKEIPKFTGTNLRYFPISSKLKRQGEEMKVTKYIEGSGFDAVEAFMKDLIATKDFYLCQELAKPLLAKFGILRDALNGEARAAQVATGQELDTLKKNLEESQKELSEWEQTVFQSRRQKFSDRFNDLSRDARTDLQNVLDPQSAQINVMMDQLHQMPSVTAAALDSKIREIQSNLIVECSERGHKVIGRFTSEFDKELSEFCTAVAAHVPSNQLVARSGTTGLGGWGGGVIEYQTLDLSQSGWDKTRTALGGAMLGIGIVTTVAHFLTVGLTLVPTFFVAMILGKKQLDHAAKLKLEQAFKETERILRETMASVRSKALQDFTRITDERMRAIRDLFQAAIKGTREQCEREMAQIRERGNQTQEALRKATAERAAVLKTLNELTSELQKIIQFSVTT